MQEKIELEINLTERQRIVFMQLFKLENDTELLQTIYNLGIKSAESILVSNMENELNKLINDVEEYNNKRNVFTEALKYLQR